MFGHKRLPVRLDARGSTEVTSGGVLEDGLFDPRKPLQIRWGELPHWRQDGALYFVTFRLGDSLPQSKLAEWRREGEAWRRLHPVPTLVELDEYSRERRRRIERWLDRGIGSCILRIPTAKLIVEKAIRYFDGNRYELGDYVVAPNHVHVLVRTASEIDLSEVLHSWKRHSSREMAKLEEVRRALDRRQRHLWQVESFDHIVRNREHLDRYAAYIRNHNSRL